MTIQQYKRMGASSIPRTCKCGCDAQGSNDAASPASSTQSATSVAYSILPPYAMYPYYHPCAHTRILRSYHTNAYGIPPAFVIHKAAMLVQLACTRFIDTLCLMDIIGDGSATGNAAKAERAN